MSSRKVGRLLALPIATASISIALMGTASAVTTQHGTLPSAAGDICPSCV